MVTLNDSQDAYEHEQDFLGENGQVGNAKMESNGRRQKITPLDLVKNMRRFNERLIKAQEGTSKINFVVLQSLIDIKQRSQLVTNAINIA